MYYQVPVERYARYWKITLIIPMLPSVNQKLKVNRSARGQAVYIDPKYLQQEKELLQAITPQLQQAKWQVAETDRYLILYQLSFPPLRKNPILSNRDLHNPLKPMCDALVHAGAINDDKLTIQEDLGKVLQKDEWARIVLYRFLAPGICLPFPVDMEAIFDAQAQAYNTQCAKE